MPLYRRLPKRGFNRPFRKEYVEVNLGALQRAIDAGRLDAKTTVDPSALQAAGLIKKPRDGVRLLAKGDLKAKLTIQVTGASKAAVAAVEKAGGKVELTAPAAPETEAEGKKAKRKAAAAAARAARQQEVDAGKDKEKAKAKDQDKTES
jgi:large subunit ribosomal protein L15